jgi:hypothetical protein
MYEADVMDFMERDVAAWVDTGFLHAAAGLAVMNLEDRCLGADLEFGCPPGAKPDDAPGEQA